jgi:hypothetical protein
MSQEKNEKKEKQRSEKSFTFISCLDPKAQGILDEFNRGLP